MATGTKTFVVAAFMAITAVFGSIGTSDAKPVLQPQTVAFQD